MTREQYNKSSLDLQEKYNFKDLPKVCTERVDFLVDLCNLKTDYILQLEDRLKKYEEI